MENFLTELKSSVEKWQLLNRARRQKYAFAQLKTGKWQLWHRVERGAKKCIWVGGRRRSVWPSNQHRLLKSPWRGISPRFGSASLPIQGSLPPSCTLACASQCVWYLTIQALASCFFYSIPAGDAVKPGLHKRQCWLWKARLTICLLKFMTKLRVFLLSFVDLLTHLKDQISLVSSQMKIIKTVSKTCRHPSIFMGSWWGVHSST